MTRHQHNSRPGIGGAVAAGAVGVAGGGPALALAAGAVAAGCCVRHQLRHQVNAARVHQRSQAPHRRQSRPLPPASQPSAYSVPVAPGHVLGGGAPQQGRPPPMAPLNVLQVKIPAELMEVREGVTYFAVNVYPESGAAWRVLRRYNHFYDLRNLLVPKKALPGAPFPKKSLLACKGAALERRREALQLWLRRTLEQPEATAPHAPWIPQLREFLESNRTYIRAPSSRPPSPGPSALAALPGPMQEQALQEPAASSHTETSPTETSLTETCLLEIEIPHGASAGELLGVTVPDGQQLTFPVPEGAKGGTVIELWYDPSEGSLAAVSPSPPAAVG